MRSRREGWAAVTIAVEVWGLRHHCARNLFRRRLSWSRMGRQTDMVLYQAEWCPYCARVRKKLTDLLLDYKTVNVPHSHAQRDVVKDVSGQTSIPVLVDGDDDIIPYLDKKYGATAKV